MISAIPSAMAMGAYGFGPGQYKNETTYGMGVFFAPPNLAIYEKPDTNAPIVEQLKWTPGQETLQVTSLVRNQRMDASKTFVAFYPDLQIAMLAAIGDRPGEDGQNWLEVIYDQRSKASGWIPLTPPEHQAYTASHLCHWMPWQRFMKLNAREHGIYFLQGVPQYHQSLRMKPEDSSKLLDVMVMRRLKVKHVRGNWLLVEALDFTRNTPLGWVRWRDDAGHLMVFPNVAGNSTQPIITTGF